MVPKSNESALVNVAINLREVNVVIIDNMIIPKFRYVSKISIGYKDLCIVRPLITSRCCEQYPLIPFNDLLERLRPSSSSDQSLLVKYKECIVNFLILMYVIPGIDDDLILISTNFQTIFEWWLWKNDSRQSNRLPAWGDRKDVQRMYSQRRRR